MRVAQRSAYGTRLAKTFYRGESPAYFRAETRGQASSVEWWTTNCQPESAESDRHLGALLLSLELANSSKIGLPNLTFPAWRDFEEQSMRPDTGVIKVFLVLLH